MENFKHSPESFRIRVIEPIKCATHTYREEAIVKSGMNPFLLDSKDVFIDLLTDSGTGTVTQSMQAAMMRDDEAYSGSHNYYALAESVKNIFGHQCTIPTHQGRGTGQTYIPVLIKKREQEKDLDHSRMVTFSNYFFDATQGHSQISGCTVHNVYIKEALDTGVRYDFKGNLDLEELERGIKEAGPNNVSYIVATITSNSVGDQPVSLAGLKAIYSIVKKHNIPVVIDSARSAENAHFIKQREAEYKDWIIEQITRETYKYTGMPAMSAKKDATVPTDGLLYMKDDSLSNAYTECRAPCVVQGGFPAYDGLEGGAMECLAVGLHDDMNLDWLAYRIARTRYLADGLEEIDVAYQQAGGHATFADTGKLLPHIPTDQFPAQVLVYELYGAAGIRAVEISSFLLGRDPKTGEQLPCPTELLRLTISRATYTQTHMDFIVEVFKHVKGNVASIKGLTFTYESKALRHSIAKLEEVQLKHSKWL